MQIREFMTQDHRECDESFAGVEEAVEKGDFAKAMSAFESFKERTIRHFAREEELLFPEFTAVTGMRGGPVEVMEYEHEQIRSLFPQLDEALKNGDKDGFLGISEGMMILLQQHNMKEEQMLYNMIQMHLGERNDELVGLLQDM